jgi:tryptophan halogenase
MEVPESVNRKIALFKANGRIYREDNELFSEMGWLQVMLGQGIKPEAYHSLADSLTDETLNEYLANVKIIVDKANALLPSHSEYISRYCAAVKI